MPHEFSLYGQVQAADQPRLLQQLAGICRMQPKPIEQLVLTFQARPTSSLASLPGLGDGSGKTDAQRIAKLLTSNVYYVKVIGTVKSNKLPSRKNTQLSNGHNSAEEGDRTISWQFEFKDIPDAGQQTVNGRLMYRFDIEEGDIVNYLAQYGYNYVNRYVRKGHQFYRDYTTLFPHQLYRAPTAEGSEAADWSFMDREGEMELYDKSGTYLFIASIDADEGNIGELRDRATSQLVEVRDLLKPVVSLSAVDRLALDTRAPAR